MVGRVGSATAGVAVSLAIAEETIRTAIMKACLEVDFSVSACLSLSDKVIS
jgi:hypothetical protein